MYVTSFNFNAYTDNPITQYCLTKRTNNRILTLEDCKADIDKLRNSNSCLSQRQWIFIGDQLRLYYALQSTDFVYADLDCILENIETLKMDHCAPCRLGANEGTYFRANSETEWVRHYFELYQTYPEWRGNVYLHLRYPIEIPTQKLECTHFYISTFHHYAEKYASESVVYYSQRAIQQFDKPVWSFDEKYGKVSGNVYHTGKKLPIEVFKAQLEFSTKKSLQFIEV